MNNSATKIIKMFVHESFKLSFQKYTKYPFTKTYIKIMLIRKISEGSLKKMGIWTPYIPSFALNS